MKTLDELKKTAEEGSEKLHHLLGNWVDGKRKSTASCLYCQGWVTVTPNPRPNDIDVGGPAVAGDCPGVVKCKCERELCLRNATMKRTVGIGHWLVIGQCIRCWRTYEVAVKLLGEPQRLPF